MNKICIIICIAALIHGCATQPEMKPAPAPIDLVKDISDLNQIKEIVPNNLEKALFVFDIDDTLLTSHQEFGSDYWFGWQFDKRNPSPVPCVLDLVAITTEEKALLPTQDDAPLIFNNIAADKLLLTARNANTARGATLRELTMNGYALPRSLGRDGIGYIFELKDKNLPASYYNGLYLVTGQNKGKALIFLLKNILKIPNRYKTIVLVDDGQRNIEKMQAAVKEEKMNYYGLHYIKINKPAEVPVPLQNSWTETWEQFVKGVGVVSKATVDRIMASRCAYN